MKPTKQQKYLKNLKTEKLDITIIAKHRSLIISMQIRIYKIDQYNFRFAAIIKLHHRKLIHRLFNSLRGKIFLSKVEAVDILCAETTPLYSTVYGHVYGFLLSILNSDTELASLFANKFMDQLIPYFNYHDES